MDSIKAQTKGLIQVFRDTFGKEGYQEASEVKITSKVDSSVFFVGSTISVLKPMLLTGEIPDGGVFLVQRAIRTHLLKSLFDHSSCSEWSSYFQAMGVLTPYKSMAKIVKDLSTYFRHGLGIQYERIVIRASSQDVDLVKVLEKFFQVEQDTRPLEYYRHRYGLDAQGIYGRNANIAIQDRSDGSFKDIGNLIVIEDGHRKYGVEIGFGASAILARLNGLPFTIQASMVANAFRIQDVLDMKFADCLSVSVHLLHEGVRPNKYTKHNRVLKEYMKGLIFYSEKLHYSGEEIARIANAYQWDEYESGEDLSTEILKFHESSLQTLKL